MEIKQHSLNKQFKDLAFFEILKRKGPYIQRSVTKIQNDLFYKHKLNGHKIKNVTFVKEIRLTLAAYQIIVNEIKNDFMMTELDSLGDSIHKLFVQMISIINFFSAIILKRQKLALNDLIDLNLQELKEKQQTIKKMEEEQKAKLTLEKQRENDRLKQIQKLKFNFRQLFKMQIDSDKSTKLIQSLWKAITIENKNNVQECMKIKDSELNRIIKDSCEYMYKNHTELDNIVRLTKQQILTSEKTLNSFTDKTHLLEENEQKINHMKNVATEIVEYVRQKVYDKKNAQTQTMLTLIDNSRPYMTTKELDQKRKMELKIKNFEKTFKEKQAHIEFIEKRLKQTEDKLKILQEKYDYGQNQSDSDEQSSRNTVNNNLARKFINTMSRKSNNQNFNSFKITPTSKTSAIAVKTRQASFTVGKKFSKLSKNLSSDINPFSQKTNKRSSSTSKQFTLAYRNSSSYNNQSVKTMISNLDMGSVSSQNSANKKFYKVRESNLVLEAKSYEEISRKSHKSRPQTQFDNEKDDERQVKSKEIGVSIDEIKICNESVNVIDSMVQENGTQIFEKQNLQNAKNPAKFTIIQTFKINIRPKLTKRYLQSAKKSDEKKPSLSFQSTGQQYSKHNKSASHKQISRYFFEPLENLQRFGSASHYRQTSILQLSKSRVISSKSPLKNSFDNILQSTHQNIQKSSFQERSTVPELNSISFIKLKNQKLNKSSLKQNSSILKRSNKKQPQSILKKSSATKQSVSFAFLPNSQKRRRQSTYVSSRQEQLSKQGNKKCRITIGMRDDKSSRKKDKNEVIIQTAVIQQETQVYE